MSSSFKSRGLKEPNFVHQRSITVAATFHRQDSTNTWDVTRFRMIWEKQSIYICRYRYLYYIQYMCIFFQSTYYTCVHICLHIQNTTKNIPKTLPTPISIQPFSKKPCSPSPHISTRNKLKITLRYPPWNKHSTWKWMVGIRSFPFGARPIFRGENVSFSEGILNWTLSLVHHLIGHNPKITPK